MRGFRRGSIAICARDSIWKTPMVSARRDHLVDLAVLRRQSPRGRAACRGSRSRDRKTRAARSASPAPSRSTLSRPRSFEIVLVPLHDGAIRHASRSRWAPAPRAALPRSRSRRRVATGGAGTPGGDQLAGPESATRFELRVVGIEAGLAHPLGDRLAAIPPLHDPREPRALLGIEAEHLGQVAQRAARAIHDDRRGDRGPIAAVLLVDVLDDLLAPLVLEVDVDVGRLVALAGDETLERAACAARGIDGGDVPGSSRPPNWPRSPRPWQRMLWDAGIRRRCRARSGSTARSAARRSARARSRCSLRICGGTPCGQR